MKKHILILLLPLLLILTNCKKDDDHVKDPVELLPPATQTGANTVGCLVNGEAFLPKGGGLSGNKNCFYQFVDGGYHFGLSFRIIVNNDTQSVSLFTRDKVIEEGQTYILDANRFVDTIGRGAGYSHFNYDAGIENYYFTTTAVTGEMTITKLDFENNIVSGTFWFDAINDNGDIVEIREGRFDMKFTQ